MSHLKKTLHRAIPRPDHRQRHHQPAGYQQGLYANDGEQTVEMGIFRVPVVDPSGCGDCFTAGIVAAQSRDWDLVRTLKFASAAGALGATALGCTNGVPSFAEVERFVKENQVKVIVNSSDNS